MATNKTNQSEQEANTGKWRQGGGNACEQDRTIVFFFQFWLFKSDTILNVDQSQNVVKLMNQSEFEYMYM